MSELFSGKELKRKWLSIEGDRVQKSWSRCVDVKQPSSGWAQSWLWFVAAERQGPGKWENPGWGENSSIWKVFSSQPGVPISSPFQFAHFPSNDSSRVITVLFTNEVWKMGERQGLSIAGSAGMHGSVSRRHRKASISLPGGGRA